MKMNVFSQDNSYPLVGEIISTTTSEFDYDMRSHCFTSNHGNKWIATVEVEHIEDDYSNYVPGKATNGGCYGFSYYKIIEVIEISDICRSLYNTIMKLPEEERQQAIIENNLIIANTDTNLIQNTLHFIEYEVKQMEQQFHVYWLNNGKQVEDVYIGGYDDPSWGWEDKILTISQQGTYGYTKNYHITTRATRCGYGRGCFSVTDYYHGANYDIAYIGDVYNTYKKWLKEQNKFFKSLENIDVNRYNANSNEIVLYLGYANCISDTWDGEKENVAIKFDRYSQNGNPVYTII